MNALAIGTPEAGPAIDHDLTGDGHVLKGALGGNDRGGRSGDVDVQRG